MGACCQAANLNQLETQCLDLTNDAEQSGSVRQDTREDAIRPALLRHHLRKSSEDACARVTLDAD